MSSSSIENLRVLARRARLDQENDKSAKGYYEKILLEDPNDWEAYFFSTTFQMVEDISACVDATAEIIDDWGIYESTLEFSADICERIEKHMLSTLNLLKNNNESETYSDELTDICKELERVLGMSTITTMTFIYGCSLNEETYILMPEVARRYIDILFEPEMNVFFSFAEKENELFGNEEIANRTYRNIHGNIKGLYDAPYFDYMIIDDSMDDTLDKLFAIDKKLDEAIKPTINKRVKEYWDSHADVMERLINEKDILEKEHEKASVELSNAKGDSYDAYIKNIKEMKSYLSTMESRYNKLGMFKKKEKEELQKLINETKDRIQKTTDALKKDSETVQPLQVKYNKLGQRIEEIESELTERYKIEKDAYLTTKSEE